ncbi:MAG TPA: MazG nucleotide pyrophosphohydrolase domain-containing protein [Candidatus Hydrogenedentes bacterium]|nr:MazG nucleotide pyrophosphohydrolase domain-containing protein [Candidatus Hydrogenedentota bacterium]HOS02383.1 MazG nucleotide pyrophosphohydrolase domain-containing protein [Candidatus Hydrogenedentota bacterium]
MFPHWKKTPENEQEWLQALADLARHLRSPEGCPWDREQTARDFATFACEEGRELIEAFETSDNAHVEEEFGDALFCMFGVAAAAEAEGRFTLENALRRAHEKMIRRHDHVFGETRAATPEDAIAMWNRIKQDERKTKN